MRLFHTHDPATSEVPGLAAAAAGAGWQSVSGRPFDSDLVTALYDINCAVHGVSRFMQVDLTSTSSSTEFRDTFRFSDRGRVVTVANVRALFGPEGRFVAGPTKDLAVCTVEVPSLLALDVQPRRYRPAAHLRTTPIGSPAFDERFTVSALPGMAEQLLTPDVQRLMMAHDDWVFHAAGTVLACASPGPFTSVDQVHRRIDEVLAIVDAIPSSIIAHSIDHSVDDLAARIGRLTTLEEGIAFLQQLTDGDRAQLAASGSPLAPFADVRTPEAAMARFEQLSMPQRMAVLGLFSRVDGS